MSYESEEKAIFNRALKRTQETSKSILRAYKTSLQSVKDNIAVYRQRQAEKPLTPGSAAQLKRLENLYAEIETIIKELYRDQYVITKKGFMGVWLDTYYASAFNLSAEVNRIETAFDVSLGYRQINKGFVANVFNRSIAGQTFRDRIGRNQIIMQSQVKDAVAQALIEGLSAKELRQRLAGIDDVFATNTSRALLTSQQELMTAYSFSQEDTLRIAESVGVEGEYIWRSVLDGKTRTRGTSQPPNHKKMDGQKKDLETRLFTFPVSGQTIAAPRIKGNGTAGLNQIMRCRCRQLFLPFGIKPIKRLAKFPDGTWKEVSGNLNYDEWAKTLKPPRTVEGEVRYRKKRDENL